MDRILEATPLADYKIKVRTSGGVSGVFDVTPYLKGSAFKELLNEAYFRLVQPAHHGIRWPNEQDFSSDTIVWALQEEEL